MDETMYLMEMTSVDCNFYAKNIFIIKKFQRVLHNNRKILADKQRKNV